MSDRHLAQLNVARLRVPLDHPAMIPFVTNLLTINAEADSAPGFVWRLQESESGNATDLRPWGEDMIVNMSVWTDVESLRQYVFTPGHIEIMRQRRAFFTPTETPYSVLWWVPAGHVPTLDEAKDRLDLLTAQGPSPGAFTFKDAYPAEAVADA
jgi:hypothetical protein